LEKTAGSISAIIVTDGPSRRKCRTFLERWINLPVHANHEGLRRKTRLMGVVFKSGIGVGFIEKKRREWRGCVRSDGGET
jgi:hypothetical protein